MVFSTTSRTRRPNGTSRGAARGTLDVRRRAAGPSLSARLHGLGSREAPRRLLWLPVALAAGIGAYYGLPFEPAAATGPATIAGAAALALLFRRHGILLWLALLGVAAAVGFTSAELRTRSVATTMIDREAWVSLEGRVASIERRPDDRRITLRDIVLVAGDRSVPPVAGVRLTVAGAAMQDEVDALRIGDRIGLRARLRPPSDPVAPGAFDFQRDAFFRGIGAVGFAVGRVAVLAPVRVNVGDAARTAVDRIRDGVAGRIRNALPDPAGAVAAAMLVGDRAGIDEPTAEAFRTTGLAHLLAISGLHMGLVAGTVFAAVRLGLAAWPAVALRRPIKKWAAGGALLAATLYLLLAGAPVPTQRAYLMTGLVLGAVLLDREAVSLHLVAWAAAVVLVQAPESLVGPSFQLSFAAVTALIAAWEAVSRRRVRRPERRRGPLRRAAMYVAGVAGTSAVASLATAPVVAHHFQQVPVLGAVANLAAVPLTAFVTMPAGVAALLAMPAGLEAWPLLVMGWAIDATLWLAARVAEGPATAVGVAALGTWPLVAMSLGGLWMALWRTGIRWLGSLAVAGGLLVAAADRPPDALFSSDGRLAAVRLPGWGWLISQERNGGFVREAWRRRWGGSSAASFQAADAGAPPDGFGCDGIGCVLRVGGRMLAMPTSPEAALEDCGRADVIVTTVRLRQGCGGSGIVVDRDDLRRGGAVAVWLSTARIRVVSVRDWRGQRPWVPTTAAGTG